MVKGGALALRAGLVIAATVGLAVMLTVLLSSLKFERKLLDVTTSRLTMVAEEVRRRAEYGLTLGLDLAELGDLQTVVERVVVGRREVDGVLITGDDRTVLFSSERGALGTKPDLPWAGTSVGDAGSRHGVAGDRLVIGSPVRNSFGQVVGEVVLDASLAPMRRDLASVRADLTTVTLTAVGVAGLLTLVAVFVTIRVGLRTGAEDDGGDHPIVLPVTTGLVEPDITGAIQRAERDLDALEAEIERLDFLGANATLAARGA